MKINLESGHNTFWNATYRVLHERSSNNASFVEHLKFQNIHFYIYFVWMMANQNKKTKIMTLYILKMLYTRCATEEAISLLPARSTWNFKIKLLLYIRFRWILANQNKTKLRTLYILKILYAECSTKEAVILLNFYFGE